MKTLKFTEHLVPLVLSGEKTVTWRLFDDKDLSVGDEVLFIIKETGEEFAKARLIKVKETDFENLSAEDKKIHDKYARSTEQMVKDFQEYYSEPITQKAKIKIVKFELIS